jgi:hypothetical protein
VTCDQLKLYLKHHKIKIKPSKRADLLKQAKEHVLGRADMVRSFLLRVGQFSESPFSPCFSSGGCRGETGNEETKGPRQATQAPDKIKGQGKS